MKHDRADMLVTNAPISAGFPSMSLKKRVWLWLRDHPGKTSTEIANGMSLQQSSISVVMKDMTDREMVARKLVHRRNVSSIRPQVFEYETCIREFEVLPKKTKVAGKKTRGRRPLVDLFNKAAGIITEDVPTSKIDIDKMPIGEARALYEKLHKLFGGSK